MVLSDAMTAAGLEATDQGVRLQAAMTASDVTLRVAYVVTNFSERNVFLFDVLHGGMGPDGVFMDPERAMYVALEPRRIVICHQIFPVPQGMRVEKRNIPFVTRLTPGSRTEASVDLDLPLLAFDPYRGLADKLRVPVRLPLFLQIGFFFGAAGTEALAKTYPTRAGPRPGFDPFPITSQRLLAVGPFPPQPAVPHAT